MIARFRPRTTMARRYQDRSCDFELSCTDLSCLVLVDGETSSVYWIICQCLWCLTLTPLFPLACVFEFPVTRHSANPDAPCVVLRIPGIWRDNMGSEHGFSVLHISRSVRIGTTDEVCMQNRTLITELHSLQDLIQREPFSRG